MFVLRNVLVGEAMAIWNISFTFFREAFKK